MISGYFFSLMAAFLWGTTHVLIKLGVTNLTTPLVGATFATLAGALPLAGVAAKNCGPLLRNCRTSLIFMALAGVCSAAGLGFQFLAFSMTPVIIASPLTCSYPIITVLLARVFLKRTELITPRVVIGALCVVVGATLITLGRPQ